MSYYSENVRFFENNVPAIFKVLTQEENSIPVELSYDRSFKQYKVTLKDKCCFINSAFDTDEEFFELFGHMNREAEVLILIGLGDGSIIDYIKNEKLKLKHLIIIEPYLDIFKLFLENFDIQKTFRELGNISLVINKTPKETSDLILELLNQKNYKIDFMTQIGYFQFNGSYVKELSDLLTVEFRTNLSQLSTLHVMRNRWLLNSLSNLKQISLKQEMFTDKLKGKPAIIVSAGPSLNKQLPYLKELKDKAILIAAGSAIKILSKNGIEPHFRMAIDADGDSDLYDEKFYEGSLDIPLLYANQLNCDVLSKYKGEKLYMVMPTDLLGKYLYKNIQQNGKIIMSGSSVVHSALSFLSQAGCEPIIFMGQDMCFYDNQIYADGRNVGAMNTYHPHSLIKMNDIYGKEVFTLRNYLQIKYDYETVVKLYKTHLINATEGGLGIEGVENKTLQDVREMYLTMDIDFDVNMFINENREENTIQNDLIINIIDKIYKETKEVVAICEERRLKIVDLHNQVNDKKKVNKLLNDLEYIDQNYESMLSKIEYYDEVIRTSIGAQVFSAKNLLDNTLNKNSYEYILGGINYLHSVTTEIEIYAELTKDWIEEIYYDKTVKEKEEKEEKEEIEEGDYIDVE